MLETKRKQHFDKTLHIQLLFKIQQPAKKKKKEKKEKKAANVQLRLKHIGVGLCR
jgi:hypothetical protein